MPTCHPILGDCQSINCIHCVCCIPVLTSPGWSDGLAVLFLVSYLESVINAWQPMVFIGVRLVALPTSQKGMQLNLKTHVATVGFDSANMIFKL